MAKTHRQAFTLVELLVVVGIIGMLVALLLPAVLRARESARRAQCNRNQEEIAKAFGVYEAAKRQLPGYVNGRPGVRGPTSWVVVLLPQLGREDLWEDWRTWRMGQPYPGYPTPGPRMPGLICPSDDPQEPTAVSYVGNCGLPDNSATVPPDTAANGVLHNLYDFPQPTMRLADIKDGASSTLLVSENIQATEWFPREDTMEPRRPLESDAGMVWWATEPWPATAGINRGRNDLIPQPPQPPPIEYARPSSFHPGGVVAAFCDGHTQFLDEGIDYRVFRQMMAPHDVGASIP
ncbi:MAG: DUF1559 family PulG-like putative transporter [Thermoguttaceae bacterium]